MLPLRPTQHAELEPKKKGEFYLGIELPQEKLVELFNQYVRSPSMARVYRELYSEHELELQRQEEQRQNAAYKYSRFGSAATITTANEVEVPMKTPGRGMRRSQSQTNLSAFFDEADDSTNAEDEVGLVNSAEVAQCRTMKRSRTVADVSVFFQNCDDAPSTADGISESDTVHQFQT